MYKYLISIVGAMLLLIAPEAHAQVAGPDNFFANWVGSHDAIMTMVYAIAYIMGLFLCVKSIFKLVDYNQSRGKVSLNVPISLFVAGVGLLAVPSLLDVATSSMLSSSGAGSFLMKMPQSPMAQFNNVLQGVMLFIRFVGVLAFIRGWLMLMDAGMGKQGMIGRGTTFIVGGVIAINAYYVASIMSSTFGFKLPF